MFWFSVSREAVSLPADNNFVFLSHKIGSLPLLLVSVKDVGKAGEFLSLGCCQTACVPVGGDSELKTSNSFETSQHFHVCNCPLSNRTARNEQEAVQVAKLFLLPFYVFQVDPVPVSSSAHSGLAKVLTFNCNIYFGFIPPPYAVIPAEQKKKLKMPFRLPGRRCL